MQHPHSCRSETHTISRRRMLQTLGGIAAGAAGWSELAEPIFAAQARRRRKRVLFVWLDGAISQLETWDPKPGTPFGGPFRSIQTRLAGVRLSELMPRMAERMHRFSIVRSMHTRFEDHSVAVEPIQRGDPANRGVTYPFLGPAVVHLLGETDNGLPPYIHIKPGSGGFMHQDAGFLGPEYGALALGDGRPPANMAPPAGITPETDRARLELRAIANRRFNRRRTTGLSEPYEHTFRIA